MRYLIKFTKESNIKFISHLDLMRTIQKVLRRAELPLEYSKGFNPHIQMSIAQPLSVGVYSSGEYLDLFLSEEILESELINRLNEKTASGVNFLSAKKIITKDNEKKLPQGMALIDACRYIIQIKYDNIKNVEEEMSVLINKEQWNSIKKTKRGEKETDIKPYVLELKYWVKDNSLVINTLLKSGSREHLSADSLVNLIKNNTSNVSEKSFVDIKREEMYYYKDMDKLEPLYKCR